MADPRSSSRPASRAKSAATPEPPEQAPNPATVLRATRFASSEEAWRVEREDGAHVCTVHLTAHHGGKQGRYLYTLPDQPGQLAAPFGGEGTFTFDGWTAETVRELVQGVTRKIEPDATVILAGEEKPASPQPEASQPSMAEPSSPPGSRPLVLLFFGLPVARFRHLRKLPFWRFGLQVGDGFYKLGNRLVRVKYAADPATMGERIAAAVKAHDARGK